MGPRFDLENDVAELRDVCSTHDHVKNLKGSGRTVVHEVHGLIQFPALGADTWRRDQQCCAGQWHRRLWLQVMRSFVRWLGRH